MVLIVEDDKLTRTLMREMLADRFPVQEAISAEQAILLLARERPELILTDCELPGISGVTLTRWLKSQAQFRTIPIVMVSARTSPRHINEALEAGCEAYYTKPLPIEPTDFVEELGQIISEHHTEDGHDSLH